MWISVVAGILSLHVLIFCFFFFFSRFKNDIKLESDDRIKIFQENSSIYIAEPSRDDVGEYKCQTAGGIPDDPLHKIILVICELVSK